MYINKAAFKKAFVLLLAVSFFFTGCSPKDTARKASQGTSREVLSAEERFEQLVDQLFYESVSSSGLTLHSTLSDPEAYGITDFPDTLGEYNPESIRENYAELKEEYEILRSIPRKELPSNLQTDYDILLEYMETKQQGEDFLLYDYPFSSVSGIQVELPIILAEYRFRSQEDVDHYLLLLEDIDDYYEQLLEYVQAQTEAGIFLSDLTIDGILASLKAYLDAPETGMMAETFEARLDELPNLTEEQQSAYLAENEAILKDDFTHAYTLLSEELPKLKGHLDTPVGVASLPDGKKYYEYLLNASTFTSYKSPKSLQGAIVKRMQTDLKSAYDLLYEKPELVRTLASFQPSVKDPEEALTDLKEKMLADFPALPACSYEVRMLPEALEEFSSPAFYLTPPIDSLNENFIYINRSSATTQKDIYTVMAHEGYPGHLYQCNYFNAVNDSRLRALLSFSCYVEGWATYVQYLSYQWEEGITPELARLLALNESAYLALYALVDYQVNYEGMTVENLSRFLNDTLGIDSPAVAAVLHQTVCEDPANYMKYYVGYLEITEMRETAEQVLGNAFIPKEFHTFLLDFGPAPFAVIREHFTDWLAEETPVAPPQTESGGDRLIIQ